MNILDKPSFYAHIFNALFLVLAFVFFFVNYSKITSVQMIKTFLLFSIAIGIHGLSHLGLEAVYYYNPIQTS